MVTVRARPARSLVDAGAPCASRAASLVVAALDRADGFERSRAKSAIGQEEGERRTVGGGTLP